MIWRLPPRFAIMRAVKSSVAITTLAVCLLAACGERASGPAAPRFELAPAAPGTLTEQLTALRGFAAAHQGAAVVVADDPAAALAARAQHADLPIVAVAVEPPPADQPLPFDAVVAPATGAEAALDLACLAAAGIAVPPTAVPIGARWFTAANLAAGGGVLPASGDPIVALLRLQHAAALHPAAGSPPRQIAVASRADDPWAARVRRELAAHAGRVAVVLHEGAATSAALQTLLAARPQALLVAADDPATVQLLLDQATAAGLPTFVLPSPFVVDVTAPHALGSGAETLGRAAALAVRQLRPNGAAVFELRGGVGDAAAAARRRGLAAGLGPQ